MKNIITLICCCVLFATVISAQPIGTSSYETKIALAETAMESQDYNRALEQYELAFEDSEDESEES